MLPGDEGHGCTGSRPHGAADERAFTAAGEGAYQGSSSRAPTDPQQIALLVRTALSRIRSRADVVGLAIHLDGVERHAQACPAHQSPRRMGIYDPPLNFRAPRNDRLAVQRDWLGDGRLKVLPRLAAIARQGLVEGDVDGCLLRHHHESWAARISGSAPDE